MYFTIYFILDHSADVRLSLFLFSAVLCQTYV
jgi:hypothetical protein